MKTTTLLALLLALAPAARAAGAGADPFNFLFLDAGARPVALGGAYTALVDDADSLLYNPAGLAVARRHTATLMHNQHFEGITQEYAAYASPWGWGLNLNSLNFGEATRTTYSQPTGAGLGKVAMNDLAFGAGYGREVLGVRAGVGLKYIREFIAGVTASGYAADLGVQRDSALFPGLSVAAALQNLGPSVRFQRAKEKLPLNMRGGAAYRFTTFGSPSVAALDVTKERSESALVAVGVEVAAGGVLPLRVGFASRNQAGPGVTAGLGFRLGSVGVDYAFVPYGDLGMAHRLSVCVRWGPEPEDRATPAPKPLVRTVAPPDANARFAAADRARAAGDAARARRELESARRLLSPDDRRHVLYLMKSGELAYDDNDGDEARELFLEAIRTARGLGTSGPAVAGSYIGLARCLADAGQKKAAREALLKALEAGPSERQREEAAAESKALGR